MKAPDKIYLPVVTSILTKQQYLHHEWQYSPLSFADENIEYIRKDLLLEWAKQKQYESTTIVADNFWQEVIDKINEL